MRELSKPTKLRFWLLVIGVSTLLIGAAYTMVQQSTRLAANDLPLATAQTVSSELIGGAAPIDVVSKIKTNLRSDTSVFVIVTDNSSHVLASSARLDGQTPLPPAGVFSNTAAHGSDHVTWQPTNGVRLATEALSYGTGATGGFIIAGQSLSQAEKRIDSYSLIALAAWLGVIVWTSLLLYWPPKLTPKAK